MSFEEIESEYLRIIEFLSGLIDGAYDDMEEDVVDSLAQYHHACNEEADDLQSDWWSHEYINDEWESRFQDYHTNVQARLEELACIINEARGYEFDDDDEE